MRFLMLKVIRISIWALASLLFLAQPVHAQGALGIVAPEPTTSKLEPVLDANVMKQNLAIPHPEIPLEDSSRYTLGINDVIKIDVLRHPEVSGEFMVNNEGKIQYEFVGDISVLGKTKDELKAILAELLSKYIISPDVTVKIIGYNSKVVYVIGEVMAPGKIFMRGDTISIREALVQAGLPTLGASTRKCRLITPAQNGQAEIKYVNVFSLLYEGDLNENVVMKPGDTLYIPATVMTKAMRVIAPVTQPVANVAGTGSTVMTGF